jgi:hypothetical protein
VFLAVAILAMAVTGNQPNLLALEVEDEVMKTKLTGLLAAATAVAAMVIGTPAMAQHGGGMHGGFGGGGFHGGMITGRSVFVPGNRFAGAAFAGQRIPGKQFSNFAFHDRLRHRHFRNFVFVGALGWPYGYDACWQQILTSSGWQWVNACDDDGY